ncbi:MAG TPA: sugar ABC transporter substrate-binding protein, partial [Fimbriimonadaceae bacterium]|nr:sugar ABC transporter substrate-binding protein [Fimbriimonadaceae bacterium]
LLGCKPTYPPGTIVLHVGNWGGAKEGNDYDKKVEKIYRDFEKENPGIVLQEESIPDSYVAKISLAYLAKAEPDIVMLDASSSALFIDSGIVTDLTPLIRNDPAFNLSDYYPNVVDIARRGKALYAIPQDFTPMVVYYNKKLFDKAGVPYPKPDWNFEQFREVARKLTVKGDHPDDPPKQYGFAFANWAPGWVMWIWNNGGDNISPEGSKAVGYLDGPKSVEAVTFLADMVKEGLAPSISQTAALGVDPFANGQAAMAISGHWSLVGYKAAPKGPDGKPAITWDDLGVVALPHNVPESQTVMYESGYAIGAHCRHREAAWKFIRYMTSHPVQAIYQSSGIAVCGRKDVAEERAQSSPLEAGFIPVIPSARAPYGARVEGYDFVEDQMQKAMDSIIQPPGSDPREALNKAAKAIEREWQKR